MTMARPRKLNSKVILAISTAVRLGAPRELAAKYGGVAVSTLFGWLQRARAGDGDDLEMELLEAVTKAEGDAVVGWLGVIEKAAGNGSWQAAAWKLERLHPKLFGRSFARQEPDAASPAESSDTIIIKIGARSEAA